LPLLLLAGCVFQDVREQQAAMQRACSVRGSVEIARPDATAAVVVLLRSGEPLGAARSWLIVDYVVLRPKNHFEFAVGPGAYRAAAFDDANADLIYQPNEGFACCIVLLVACGTSKPQRSDAANEGLAGSSWRLVQFVGGDDTKVSPDDRSKYTLTFVSDTELAVRFDCNRGRATWKSADPR